MRRGQVLGALVAALAALSCGSSKSADSGSEPTLAPAKNTVPFEGGAYVVTDQGDQNGSVRRFWPTDAGRAYTGFRLGAEYFGFRPTDGQLFYFELGYGIHIDDAVDDQDTMAPTPPCVRLPGDPPLPVVDPRFGFDGQGTLHYDCDASISRGDGIVIHTPAGLGGVLADGRVLLVESTEGGDHWSERFTVRSATGELLTTLHLPLHEPLFRATTVQGNDAFVLFARYDDEMEQLEPEFDLVMYRLDSSSAWLPIRTVTRPRWTDFLALSDGTIFSLGTRSFEDQTPVVTAFLPDGRKQEAWHGTPTDHTRANSFLTGPKEPSGPSVH